jgi:hypothetical protein
MGLYSQDFIFFITYDGYYKLVFFLGKYLQFGVILQLIGPINKLERK